MSALNYIFAVIDPTQDSQPALQRAITLASEEDSYVHAFLCDYSSEQELNDASSKHEAKHQVQVRSQELLGKVMTAVGDVNCKLGKEVYWNKSWAKSATLASGRQGADLLIKTISPSREKTMRFKSADRYLLRNASCPVLLALPEQSGDYKKIVAAVDLESADDTHMRLNHAVISSSRQLAERTGAELYVVSAYVDQLNQDLLEEQECATQQEQIARTFGIPTQHVFLERGPARDVILEASKRLNADMLVIGTSARKGLAGALLGNTAEKILTDISCDVLAVS